MKTENDHLFAYLLLMMVSFFFFSFHSFRFLFLQHCFKLCIRWCTTRRKKDRMTKKKMEKQTHFIAFCVIRLVFQGFFSSRNKKNKKNDGISIEKSDYEITSWCIKFVLVVLI